MSDFLAPLVSFPSLSIPREAYGEATLCLEVIHPVRVKVSLISAMKMVLSDELVSITVIYDVLWSHPGGGLDAQM